MFKSYKLKFKEFVLNYLHQSISSKFEKNNIFLFNHEIQSTTHIIRSGKWNINYGKNLIHEKLEKKFADYIGVEHAVVVNTGGMAIQIALRALGLKPGNEIIHQVDTCVANSFAIINAGVTPIFSDIDQKSFMLNEQNVLQNISENTKAIIPIHMWGNVENITMIKRIASKKNLLIIEDACLALGATFNNKKIGSFGNVGIFSFGCLKPIQCGEGGMIVTNDASLAKELRTIRNWGDTENEFGVRDQKTLSWNGRISEILAAVVLEQLTGYEDHLNRILENVVIFEKFIEKINGIDPLININDNSRNAYTQYIVKINPDEFPLSKLNFMSKLAQNDIDVWHGNFELINQLSFFKNENWREWIIKGDLDRVSLNYKSDFPNAIKVYNQLGIGFSKNNFLTKKSVQHLIKGIEKILLNKN